MNRIGVILIIIFVVIVIITTVLLIVLLPEKKKSFAIPLQDAIGEDDFVQDPRLETYTQQTSFCNDPINQNDSKCKILKYLSDPEKFYIPNIKKITSKLNQFINIEHDTPSENLGCRKMTIGLEILKLFIDENNTVEQIEQTLNPPQLILIKYINHIMTGQAKTYKKADGVTKVDSILFDCKGNRCTEDMDSIKSVSVIIHTRLINLTDLENPKFSIFGSDDIPFNDKYSITAEELGYAVSGDTPTFQTVQPVNEDGKPIGEHFTLYTISGLQFRQMCAIDAFNSLDTIKTLLDKTCPTGSGDVSGTPLAI